MVGLPGEAVTTSPLLATKLYVPQWRPGLVSRPRLVERLDQGTERKLTLVSAPAGFGKTTLLAEWLGASPASERPAAWVSLDQRDNDPALFWAYFIAALQTVQSGIGESTLSLLQSPQPPPIEALLGTLLNEITAIADDPSTGSSKSFVVILDDYHLIDAEPVHSGITFLLSHLPPQMHLVLASRSDPPLALARLRGRGELAELRASELRFTADEAAAFLNEVMGLGLSAADVAALESRTEGWIAGLQLAALSMQGRDDVAGFITAFAGDDRYIVDYLVEEVLQRQPERVRTFLLQTSILDRLSGPLCDAVTGRESGKGVLEALERGNLFVVPLDDKRHWYRYHHLFADVLQAHSRETEPDLIPSLHRRASEWYEQNDSPPDAIRHALAAEDFDSAARLLELAWPAMRRGRQEATWYGWAKALPDELVRSRPVLSVAYALGLLDAGELEAAERPLRDAERWLDSSAYLDERPGALRAAMVAADEEQLRSLPASLANARAYHAVALGDVPGTVKHARQALDLLAEGDYYERGTTGALLGLAYWASGDLEAAHRTFADGLATLNVGGATLIAIGGTRVLAEIRVEQGRLREAASTYEQALERAAGQGHAMPEATADLYVGLSELHREWGDLEAARQDLLRSDELSEQVAVPSSVYHGRVAKARLQEALGDPDGALDLLNEEERLFARSPIPDVRPATALRTRVWLAQGRLTEALAWVRERDLSVDDELSYPREFEHLTLARVLIARFRSDGEERSLADAMGLLGRLQDAAEEGRRMGSTIEILTLQALAHEAQGDIPGGLAPLERAVSLAEPEGYLRTFVDQGEPMRTLLRHAAAAGVSSAYTQQLLSAFDGRAQPALVTAPAPQAELAEPLTAREVEILRLVAAGMRNQEIADQLVISVATVKRHIANVYGKLGVGHRTEAVARANELKLL